MLQYTLFCLTEHESDAVPYKFASRFIKLRSEAPLQLFTAASADSSRTATAADNGNATKRRTWLSSVTRFCLSFIVFFFVVSSKEGQDQYRESEYMLLSTSRNCTLTSKHNPVASWSKVQEDFKRVNNREWSTFFSTVSKPLTFSTY